MDLVKAGETAQVSILGETFQVKVMSVFDAAEWEDSLKSCSTLEFLNGIADRIVSIEGYEKPLDLIRKIKSGDDLTTIIESIISASGLGDSEVKNSNSSLAQVTTINSEPAGKIAERDESPVSITEQPTYTEGLPSKD